MYSVANSTHSTMTTVAKCVYDDFLAPTPLRSARVIIEGRSLYVNPGWLAEFSSFFAAMFFGKNVGEELTLGSEFKSSLCSYDGAYYRVHNAVLGDSGSFRHITLITFLLSLTLMSQLLSNVIVVLKMAHYFGMKPVIEKCEDVIVRQANTLDRVKLFQIACAVAEHDRYSPTMTLLIDKLSAMKREELSKLRFSQ
ncbi:unnamed protein product, partial [Brugia timori]|uniref:BTB domain-containing protein n=1 Tax=Brugia timori TaxID=42155 RepID=A0A0R3Q917_9BILA